MKEEATIEPGRPLVEFLYDPDCPSHEEALQRLQDVIAELGQPVPIAVTAVTSHEQAQVQRFPGSPTIRVNGSDIEAGAERRGRFALTCRAYVKGDGRISPLPPREMISDALRRARIGSS